MNRLKIRFELDDIVQPKDVLTLARYEDNFYDLRTRGGVSILWPAAAPPFNIPYRKVYEPEGFIKDVGGNTFLVTYNNVEVEAHWIDKNIGTYTIHSLETSKIVESEYRLEVEDEAAPYQRMKHFLVLGKYLVDPKDLKGKILRISYPNRDGDGFTSVQFLTLKNNHKRAILTIGVSYFYFNVPAYYFRREKTFSYE